MAGLCRESVEVAGKGAAECPICIFTIGVASVRSRGTLVKFVRVDTIGEIAVHKVKPRTII